MRELHRRRHCRARARAVLSFAACMLAACTDQPKPDCVTSTAAFAMKLLEQSREQSAPGACDAFGLDAFNQDPEVGIVPYFARGDRGQPDAKRGSLAIQTAELGLLYDTALARGEDNLASDGASYSLGNFVSGEPDRSELCYVPELSPTRLLLPELPSTPDDPSTPEADESAPGQPAVDATLEWSNVQVYVTAEILGTQVAADLLDTRRSPDGQTCSVQYRALALAPAIPCALLDPETGAPVRNDDGSPQLDPAACEPEADPSNGRPVGSGISPRAAFVCDPSSAFCVLDGESVPALR